MPDRQIVLDTETTGLEPSLGHRIIEIGCVELINRKHSKAHFHQYINPEREVDAGALEVHGLSNEFLETKPLFEHIVDDFIQFVEGAELIIHNAPFDVGFIDHELQRMKHRVKSIKEICTVVDSLTLARKKHPGQKNNLDALCRRYTVDNSNRTLHGALLDSEILADVYLLMTGGQTILSLSEDIEENTETGELQTHVVRLDSKRKKLPLIKAKKEELAAHKALLDRINSQSDQQCLWLQLTETE